MENTPCTYRISVKAIITDDAQSILLVRERNGSWELPGGGIEHGEDVKEALIREIVEETGMHVTWIDDQPETFWTIRKDVKVTNLMWFAFIAYRAKIAGTFNPHRASDEAQEANYFSIEEVRSLELHDNTKPYFTV